MQNRHINRDSYFSEQAYTTEKFVIPFIGKARFVDSEMHVLEIGSGEGGNMKPLLDMGCKVTGIEIEATKHAWAIDFFKTHPNRENLSLICEDIYKYKQKQQFQVIIIRDVVEHIHNQERFMTYIRDLLTHDGCIFIAFPPWQNPFGGHQQVCENKLLSVLPFFHLLPVWLYKMVLRLGGEKAQKIDALLEIKETGISIERFKRIIVKTNYTVLREVFYFINPNYEIKFGLKPRVAWKLISKIPYLRNLFVTSYYCVLSK